MITEAFICLALNVYFEARHLPPADQENVAHVVLNRVDDPRFPDSVCEVIREGGTKRHRCQFSWYCDGKSDVPYESVAWNSSKDAAVRALIGDDTTGGALFYRAVWSSETSWWKSLTVVHKDSGHVFYSLRD